MRRGLQCNEIYWVISSDSCKYVDGNIFFQKLCEGYEQIVASNDIEWYRMVSNGIEWFMVLELDEDNSVLNPNHLIESYQNNSKYVIHYLRFHNNDAAAGNHILRNSEQAQLLK